MKDLTSTEAVLAALESCDHYDHGCARCCAGCRENTETAAYLARAVAFFEKFKGEDFAVWDKRLSTIVNQQAEDDGLWFAAETAPEAYLQKELRRLTAEVESALAIARVRQ